MYKPCSGGGVVGGCGVIGGLPTSGSGPVVKS